jgi:hypothetical protein
MTNMTHAIALSIVAAMAVMGCAASDPPPRDVAATEQAVTCTPGYETCDYACYYNGGPTTDDCIIQCNATGTGWITIQSCGYAQNLPYSSSCLDSQPHPICQNN